MIAVLPLAGLPLAGPTGDLVQSFDWHWAPPLWLFALVLLPAVFLYAGYIYSRESTGAPTAVRVFLGGLRALAILLLLGILFDPFFERTSYVPQESHVLVLYDASQSMRDIRDSYEGAESFRMAKALGLLDIELPPDLDREEVQLELLDRLRARDPMFDLDQALAADRFDSRAEVVNVLIGPDDRGRLRQRLRAKHRVIEYLFSTADAKPGSGPDDPPILVPRALSRDFVPGLVEGKGPETALRDAVAAALAEFGAKPVAAVVVVTDGRSNSDREIELDPDESWAKRLGVPVYTIGIGNPNPPRDVELTALEAEEFVFKDEKAAIEARLTHAGYEGREIEVHLELPPDEVRDKTDGEPLVKNLVLGPDGARQSVVFHHTFRHKGEKKLRVRVKPLPKEWKENNNFREVTIRVLDEKIRVLYVEGLPRWEYRVLRNALVRDSKLLVNLILLDADPTFPQDKSPDAPDMNEIPATPEAIRKFKDEFHVVIFGDFPPSELGEGRDRFLKELKDWVESDFFGGGFIQIAGPSATPEQWAGTEIASMLPIEILDDRERGSHEEAFYPRRTPLGEIHPILTLDPDYETNERLWTDTQHGLPGLYWYKKVRRTRPGAQVLLVHPTDKFETERGKEAMPILAVARYGQGQTMFMATDETWRWRFLVEDKRFWPFWKQAIFFMAKRRLMQTDSRWRIWTEKTEYQAGARIQIYGEVRDETSVPSQADEQTIHYKVTWRKDDQEHSTERRSLKLTKIPDQPGRYQGSLLLLRPGEYRFWFLGKGDKDAALTEKGVHTIQVFDATLETRIPSQDRELLRKIAAASEGAYLPIHDLANFPDIAPRTRLEPIEKTEESVWHRPWTYLAVLVLLSLEWILRKFHRML